MPVRSWCCCTLPVVIGMGLSAMLATPAAAVPAGRGDPAKGQQLAAQVCGACHNPDGNSVIPTNPKLAGQSAEYLVKQLGDLAKPPGDKTGRENAIMAAFAVTLSPADRLDAAAWFSSQPARWLVQPEAAPPAEDLELGQRIYRAGLPEKAVPACAGCHGPVGAGLPALYPRIGGQHAEYLQAQLHAFREGTRRNNVAMWQIAFRLSDPEIRALAVYVAGLHAR